MDKKSHKTAFIFSGILHLLGLGSFYIDRHILGAFQLVHTAVSIVVACISFYFYKDFMHKVKSCLCKKRGSSRVVPFSQNKSKCDYIKYGLLTIFSAVVIIGRIIWWIVEVVLFAKNTIKDGDGCDLYSNTHEI